ncbi:MAG: lamin tail domain-containing protein [Candidatus Jorgensenbacteria bacterium]|nr:lamin tail domain-containing protein [Candidatus Jorgensenbacteria bacterium]
MKIFASGLVIVAIIGFAIYMSGGITPFMENILSTKTGEESEVINLDAPGNVVQKSASVSEAVSAKKVSPILPKCIITSDAPTHASIIISEVAWMGSENDTKREWIELKNISSSSISLSGWELLDKSKKIDVQFSSGVKIAPNVFYVISRGRDFTGTINNSDESLSLFDSNCALVDAVSANPGWVAGNNETWKTAERDSDLGWHTSELVNGTPGKENSSPTIIQSQAITSSTVVSSIIKPEVSKTLQSSSSFVQVAPQSYSILISEVMTGMKGVSNYDFVELYNNADSPAVLDGVSIKKKSSTGKESTLVSESRLSGKTIPAHGFLLLANESGYTGRTKPDVVWPSSYSLSAVKNGITVYGANSKTLDFVYWDSISDGSSFVRDGWDSTLFHLNSAPTPQNSASNI